MDKTRKTSKRRPRRSFTPEFKAEAVRLCRIGDRSVAQVAKDLDLIETVLRECAPRANARPLLAHACGPRELDPAGRRPERDGARQRDGGARSAARGAGPLRQRRDLRR
jgi:transposase-like protein